MPGHLVLVCEGNGVGIWKPFWRACDGFCVEKCSFSLVIAAPSWERAGPAPGRHGVRSRESVRPARGCPFSQAPPRAPALGASVSARSRSGAWGRRAPGSRGQGFDTLGAHSASAWMHVATCPAPAITHPVMAAVTLYISVSMYSQLSMSPTLYVSSLLPL